MDTLLLSQVEALLFIAGKPLKYKGIASRLAIKTAQVEDIVTALNNSYQQRGSGLRCIVSGDKVQLFTAPEHDALVADFLKAEQSGELTKPSIETLSIIAYRGPLTKEELEYIRGINCTLIVRNLLIRGLIEEVHGAYVVTHEFLRHLGVQSVTELPNYESLHDHEQVELVLEQLDATAAGEKKDSAKDQEVS